MYTVHCIIYRVQCILYNIYCKLYNVHCTMYTIQCILYTVHCTMYNAHCTLYIVQYIPYNVQTTQTHYNIVRWTLYTASSPYTVDSLLHIVLMVYIYKSCIARTECVQRHVIRNMLYDVRQFIVRYFTVTTQPVTRIVRRPRNCARLFTPGIRHSMSCRYVGLNDQYSYDVYTTFFTYVRQQLLSENRK